MENLSIHSLPTNPFVSYPSRGRRLLGRLGGDNCRHGYGLKLYQTTKSAVCAYCDTDLVSKFVYWMSMSVDHVVPRNVGQTWNIPKDWYLDIINCVFCCRFCNELDNRNELKEIFSQCPNNFEEFLEVRDKAFNARYQQIAKRRQEEQDFYESVWGGTA